MSTNTSIPLEERSELLKPTLRKYAEIICKIRQERTQLAREHQHLFLFLVYPWVAEAGGDAALDTKFAADRAEYSALGFRGDEIADELRQLLNDDRHLRECCFSALNLAHFLDIEFVTYAAFHLEQKPFSDDEYEKVFSGFSDYVYSQPFKTVSASHLYNFESDDENLFFEGLRVVTLEFATISNILGETNNRSFIHPHGVGQYFVVTEQFGPNDNVFDWLWNERQKATEFASILQYFKDGVVHVDYTVPHFFPLWVNQIRKQGVFYLGDPHRLWYAAGERFYHLSNAESEQVNEWGRSRGTGLL
jgi:hypothetical protein